MAINRDIRVDFIGRDRSQSAAKSAASGVKRVNLEVKKLATRTVAAQRAFSALTIGFAGTNAVRTLGDLQESLLRVKNLSLDFGKDQQFLSKTTRQLNLDLQDAAKAYSDILVLQSTGYVDNDQAQSLFIGFQETAKKFGVGANDIQFALRGLRQALTAGVVRAQEFDQIFDAIGAVTPAVAKNLGITTQELLKLRTSASLSSKALLDALIPALREADGSAAKASTNINASLQRLSNAYKEALLNFQEPLGEGIGNFADAGVAAIDGLVEHADKIQLVGAAIASAYGGRALQAIANNRAEALQSLQVSQAQVTATEKNNSLLLVEEKNREKLARREAFQNSQYVKSLEIQKKGAETLTERIRLQRILTGARALESEAIKRHEGVLRSVEAAQNTYATSQRAASVAGRALTATTTALRGAMSLVGGPIGVAAIAIGAFVLKAREGSAAIRDLRKANEELENRAAVIGGRAFEELAGAREAAEIKLNKLYDERTRILRGQAANNTNLTASVGEVSSKIVSVNAQIRDLKQQLDSLELKEENFRYADSLSQEIDAINEAAKRLARTFDASDSLIEKFLPDRAKIAELKAALDDARKSFQPDDATGKEVVSAIQTEIDKLSGATKARDEYGKKIKDNRRELDQLNDSLRTERERIESTFNSAQATIKINVELGTLDDTAASTVLAKARERMYEELRALDEADLEQTRRGLEEKQRLREQEVADIQQYRDRLVEARSVIDPTGGEVERFRNELLDLNAERGNAIQGDKDYYLLVEAAKQEHTERMDAIAKEQVENQRKRFSELSVYDKISTVGGIASDFVDAFKKNVGSYITLTENMTDAEKKQATVSNAINKKRFEDNKKASIAQAIISTITGATRAFETVPYPANFIAAAAIAAAGFRNVANIRSARFGSGGGTSVSTGGAVASTELSASDQPAMQNVPQERVTYFIYGNPQSDDEAMLQASRAMQRAVATGYVDDGGVLNFDNVPDRVVRLVG